MTAVATAHGSEQLVVPLRKGMIVLMFLGAAAFVALGLSMYLNADQSRRPPLFVKAVAVVCVGVFGLVAVGTGAKLFDMSPGLIIDAEGIVDNSIGIAAGRIPWSDIKRIRTSTSEKRGFLTIEVHDPQKYIRRARWVKRVAVTQNMRFFGSPIHISVETLRIDFDDLRKAVKEFQAKNKRT
jgi:hypothetical protein